MKALVTGASSGIGREMTCYLAKQGHKVFAVARRIDRLNELESMYPDNITALKADLSTQEECIKLYDKLRCENLDIVINNAGLGVYGEFSDTSLDAELRMIDINIKALHILTKQFLVDFKKKNRGYIMNVSSSAGFMMGPLFSSYYASKAYVLRLTQAISQELKECKSDVKISVFCPGPVKTEFDSVANIKSSLKGISSHFAAKYAIDNMLKGKNVIIPGFTMKLSVAFSKFIPQSLLAKITYTCQKRKSGS